MILNEILFHVTVFECLLNDERIEVFAHLTIRPIYSWEDEKFSSF